MSQLDLKEILETLSTLEPLYHAACPAATVKDFENLVAAGFWEVGAGGNTYSREFALNALKNRQSVSADMWQTNDYAIQPISHDVVLLTYILTQPMRVTKRSTIWHHIGQQWQAVYHQGTIVTKNTNALLTS